MQIDTMIRSMIESHDDWSEKDKIIQSVPGIGPKTSQVLISAMPKLGKLNRQEIAALVGVTPFNVVQQKGRFKDFFEGLLARGKSYKVAMVTVMRKLITTLNVMLEPKTTWQENAG